VIVGRGRVGVGSPESVRRVTVGAMKGVHVGGSVKFPGRAVFSAAGGWGISVAALGRTRVGGRPGVHVGGRVRVGRLVGVGGTGVAVGGGGVGAGPHATSKSTLPSNRINQGRDMQGCHLSGLKPPAILPRRPRPPSRPSGSG